MPTFQSDFHRGYQSSNGKSIVDIGGRKSKMRCFIHFNIFSDFWGSLFGTNSDSNSVVLPGEVLNATRHVFFHFIGDKKTDHEQSSVHIDATPKMGVRQITLTSPTSNGDFPLSFFKTNTARGWGCQGSLKNSH